MLRYHFILSLVVAAFSAFSLADSANLLHEEANMIDSVEKELPVKPSESSRKKLIGEDKDGDLIWDELEHIILKEYPGEESRYLRNSLYNIAFFYHSIFRSKPGDLLSLDGKGLAGWLYLEHYFLPSLCIKADLNESKRARQHIVKFESQIMVNVERFRVYAKYFNPLEFEAMESRKYLDEMLGSDNSAGKAKFRCQGSDDRTLVIFNRLTH